MIKITSAIKDTVFTPILMAGVVLTLLLTFVGVGFLSKSITVADIEKHEVQWNLTRPEAFSYTVEPICLCRPWPYKVVVYGKSFTVSPIEEMPQELIENWKVLNLP